MSIRDERVLASAFGRTLTQVTVTYDDEVRGQWATVERHVVYEVTCDDCGESIAQLDNWAEAADQMSATHDCEAGQ